MTSYDYVVGLPVVVTVRDDGAVTYWIDTAEAGTAIRKDADNPENDPHGDLTEVNARLVDLDHVINRAQSEHRSPAPRPPIFDDALEDRAEERAARNRGDYATDQDADEAADRYYGDK